MKRILEIVLHHKLHRHFLIIVISALVYWWFISSRPMWLPEMHIQNKAFGDISLILIVLILCMGAVSRFYQPVKRLLPWQQELGIWAMMLALIHIYIVIDGWVEWRFQELFGFAFYQKWNRWLLTDPGFALANIIGILALVYGIALLITSNRLSVRILTYSSWKYLQQLSVYFLYILTSIHTAYFLYFYFVSFPKQPPPPNFFKTVFPILIAMLSTAQLAAFIKTVCLNRSKER